MKILTSLTLGIVFFTGMNALADRRWNEANDPKNFEPDYVYNFNRLPVSGNLDETNKGWSDSYWPATRGYISDRWQVKTAAFNFKKYAPVSSYRVGSMSAEEINLLSPGEKFDIARGKLDFPILKEAQKANPSDGDWWRGYCNGWTRSSLNIDEPQAIVYTAPHSGIKIPFGSGDIKALLAHYYSKIEHSNSQYIGKACRATKRFLLDIDGSCSDMNAAAFHVAMANELGIRKRGFAMDRDQTIQTWNQPYVGFTTKVIDIKTKGLYKRKTEGTVKEVYVSTTVKYVNELYDTEVEDLENDEHVAPSYEALGKGKQHYRTNTYEYVLELDSRDNIIGGDWTGGDPHPDLMWRESVNPASMATQSATLEDNWTLLSDIVKMATAYASGSAE